MARKPIIDRDDAARPGTDGSEEAGAESVSETDLFAFRSDISRNVVSDSDPFAVRADVGQDAEDFYMSARVNETEVVASANVG